MTKKDSNTVAIIAATDVSPEIRYVRPGEIEIIGYDDVEAQIVAELDRYFPADFDGTIPAGDLPNITREDVKAAKAIRASMNSKAKAVNDRRGEVKKALMEPLVAFELKANHLRDLYKAKADLMGSWVGQAEGYVKEQLRARLVEFYQGLSIIADAVPFEAIEQKEWYNLTFGEKKAEEAIEDATRRIAADLEVLEEAAGEWKEAAMATYVATLNLSEAMAEVKRRREAAQRARELEAERAAILAEQQAAAEAAEAAQSEAVEQEPIVQTAPEPSVPSVTDEPVASTPVEAPVARQSFTLRFEGEARYMATFMADLRALITSMENITYTQIRSEV